MAKRIIPRTRRDELDVAVTLFNKAAGMVDVLSELTSPGGDDNAGAIALDQLKPGSLSIGLQLVSDMLVEAGKHLEGAHG